MVKITFEELQPGDRVTIEYPLRGMDDVPQCGQGKIVMRGPYGWVANMGGQHGRPEVVTIKNFVSAKR